MRDAPLPYRMIEIDGGQQYALTDSSGEYNQILTHGNHTLTHPLAQYWFQPCQPAVMTVTIDTANPTVHQVDFPTGMTPNIVDMRISYATVPSRPGFQQNHTLFYENVGTSVRTGVVWLALDTLFDFQIATPTPDLISADTLYWNYTSMAVGQSATITVTTSLPADTGLLGQSFFHCAQVDPVSIDQTPGDNIEYWNHMIVGSYDPNDKTAFPTTLYPGDRDIDYLIRFQNTGTDTAFTVVITIPR